jgi:hypothetical protein
MERSNDSERGGGGRLFQRRRPCRFCLEKAPIDFKDRVAEEFSDRAGADRPPSYFGELHAASA